MEHKGILDIEKLNASYICGKPVLRDVSLHMHEGEIICVIGESGSGKSTLINSILRMPGSVTVDSGRIVYGGQNLTELTEREMQGIRGTEIGLIYQEPGASLNPIRSIGAQFYQTLREARLGTSGARGKTTRKEAYNRAEEALESLGLPDVERILRSCPAELSGGMNQRVSIALSICLMPSVLIADEPTSALDVTTQALVADELMKLRERHNTCVLVVTHNMGVVARMADKVAVMYGGRIVEYGYKDSVLSRPCHPYTRLLMAAGKGLSAENGRLENGEATAAGLAGAASKQTAEAQNPNAATENTCAFMPRCPAAGEKCAAWQTEQRIVEGEHWVACCGQFDS